jgi:hypothetical protein
MARAGMPKDKNVAQVTQRNIFEGTIFPLLRPMEGVLTVTFDEASLAPPIGPITISTAKLGFCLSTSRAIWVGWAKFKVEKMPQISCLVSQELFQEVILALHIVREWVENSHGRMNTSVCLCPSSGGPSKSHCSGSTSKPTSFGRFMGEEDLFVRRDEDAFWLSRRGVWTSSSFNVSLPRRVRDGTILSSRTIPFRFTFLAFEKNDIVGPGKRQRGSWESVGSCHTRKLNILGNASNPGDIAWEKFESKLSIIAQTNKMYCWRDEQTIIAHIVKWQQGTPCNIEQLSR